MTLYGDLDVSVIDELPPGRRPVRTVHYTDAARLRVWGFLRRRSPGAVRPMWSTR